MAKHNETGAWGEEMARNHLRRNGYTVLDKNIHIGHSEIDIIALKGDIIAFVEVKTRSTAFTDPLDAINEKKIRRLAKAADSYMKAFSIRHNPQFDIITIVGTPESGFELNHYPDAFMPPLTGAW